jgi:uncharacterized C2H2 Zn-finger protein
MDVVADLEAALRERSATRRAVEARVRRKLARDGESLHRCARGTRWYSSLGDYYLTDDTTRFVARTHLHLDDLARELGVLAEGVEITD